MGIVNRAPLEGSTNNEIPINAKIAYDLKYFNIPGSSVITSTLERCVSASHFFNKFR
jgi:hypothetical protein